ncbi:Ig-like domain-containing protein [Aquimarina pacifica]|uniref:Ig-like domain-containing protein n=1 Tax=Aquimarina pacifica TaxID=1296415 RepID=UPI00047217C1|nr:Ig-like domain-containing protein [Aquimarina pacifica]
MRATNSRFLLMTLIFACFVSCIGEDIIEDTIDPILRIDNPLISLAVGETHQFEATYLNNIGQEENVTFLWTSSDDTIISINELGLATALKEGEAIISVRINDETENAITRNTLQVSTGTVLDNDIKTGVIKTTSSYELTGDFMITEQSTQDNIRISISDNYSASTALPGLYLYLTNNPNSIENAFEVGPVTVFSGAHVYDISDQEVGINQYGYLLYWCKPFSVKVGEGKIN